MARFRPFILVLLILVPVLAAHAQVPAPPPQITFALNALSSQLGRPITMLDLTSWTYTQNLYTDTALGCPYANGTAAPQGISGYTFNLVYQGISYDYRVAADGSVIFPCDPNFLGQPQPTPEGTNCPAGYGGFLPPRLEIGGQGHIGESGTANRLRALPSVDAQQIGLIQPGTTVDIIGGPSCEEASHIIWWRVSANDVIGWTAEGVPPDNYFLSPVNALPAERSLITTDNVGTLATVTTIPLAGVTTMSFSTSGALAAFGGSAGLSVYNLATLTLDNDMSDPNGAVTAVAFSPDGRYLAYGKQDGGLLIADTLAKSWTMLVQLANIPIDSLAFSPGTDYLLAAGSGSPTGAPGVPSAWQIFDVPNQHMIATMPTGSWVHGVGFSGDGTLFAWVDSALHVVQVTSGADVRTIPLAQPTSSGLLWRPAPVGALPQPEIAFADGSRIRLTNVQSNVEQTYIADPDFLPGSISFSHDGALLAAMSVSTNTATGSVVNVFDSETGDVISNSLWAASTAITFSPDGTLLAIASADQVIVLGVDTSELAVG